MGANADVQAAPKKRHVGGPWAPAGFSWSLFEFGRNPYYMLVVIYVFAPYFARHVAGGGVEGAAKVADIITLSGFICALTAPFLGALMDRGGRRKGILAVFFILIVSCSVALWWAEPHFVAIPDPADPTKEKLVAVAGAGGLGVTWTVVLMTTAFVCYTYSEVMHNAMLPAAGRPDALPHISGIGLGLGNLAAVLGLTFVTVSVVAPGLFGFDEGKLLEAKHEQQRFTGPLTGVWMAIFVIPFFLYMPDGSKPGGTWSGAAAELFGIRKNGGFNPIERLQRLGRYFADLFRTSADTMRYLIGRMIYADGLTAVMTLGGVYTATFLGWSAAETALYGIYASLFAAAGAFLAGRLDSAMGAKKAIILEVSIVIASMIYLLSITPDAILFGMIPAGHAVLPGEIFERQSDLSYLGGVAVMAAAITACISSSRYMLVAVAPKERIGEFFGFYAMAATLTVWMGPLLYSTFSRSFNDQRIGMAAVLSLFVIGIAILMTVKHTGRPEKGAPVVSGH